MVEDLNKYIKGVCDGSIFITEDITEDITGVCDGSIFITEDITEDIKFDDIVRLKVGSIWDNGNNNNPIYTDGVVVDIGRGEFALEVRWDNGYNNFYSYNDLELIIR